MSNEPCTEKCRTPVECTTCKRRKSPIGRSVPLEMCIDLCDYDCPGYRADPYPPHLWPSECFECGGAGCDVCCP